MHKRGLGDEESLFGLFATSTTFHIRPEGKCQAEGTDACCKECLNEEHRTFLCKNRREHFQKEMKLEVGLEGCVKIFQIIKDKHRNARSHKRTSSVWAK